MTDTSACTTEEKRDALDRALHSKTFARSEQLRNFLHFVCDAEMAGTAEDLTEQVIGVEVLGRPAGYSPAEDSSVRTRAYELRQKLDKLYAQELRGEAVRICIPKGTYTPVFLRTEGNTAGKGGIDGESTARRRLTLSLVAACMLGLLLGALAMWLTQRNPAGKTARPDPVLQEAWKYFARPDANVVLCAATPLHLVVGPSGHQAANTLEYPAPPEAYPMFRQHRPLAPGARLGLLFTDNVLGVGTMNAVLTASNLLRTFGAGYEVLPERVATLSALRERNAILFGAPVDSEAITRTLEGTPLTVDYEPSVREFVIRDRSTGRMIVPKKDANGEFVDVYGLLTVLNTRESSRGRLGMVVFSGITSAGTQGVAEYFASARSMRGLRAAFAKEGVNGFPAAYQVVVKCTYSNWLLLGYEYNSHKILQRQY